jgi:glutathione synthase/RimK-type ligase-like ATP-grasp enzyme
MDLQITCLQPREGYLFRIGDGKHFFNHQVNVSTINSHVGTNIAKDKVYTYVILQAARVQIPRGDYYFRPGFFNRPDFSLNRGVDEAYRDALAMGMGWSKAQAQKHIDANGRHRLPFKFPLIVKPNGLSQGKGVSRIDAAEELRPAIDKIFALKTDVEYVFIVQEYVVGKEYRLIMLDGDLLLCYEKKYLSIIGDGTSTIDRLISAKNSEFTSRGDKLELINPHDPLLQKVLNRDNFNLKSVLPSGRELVLNDVTANLETGARAFDVTKQVSREQITLAKTIADQLKLRYLGIDFRCAGIEAAPSRITVLEVNSNPGLAHFFLQGNEEVVYAIYERLFTIMLAGGPR